MPQPIYCPEVGGKQVPETTQLTASSKQRVPGEHAAHGSGDYQGNKCGDSAQPSAESRGGFWMDTDTKIKHMGSKE